MMYLLAYEQFRTKAEIEVHCRRITDSTQYGKPVSSQFVPFLLELFSFHDDWHELSANIRAIVVLTTYQGSKCFSIEDNSGCTTDISIKKVISLLLPMNGKRRGASLPADYRVVAQASIAPDINAFMEEQLKTSLKCIHSGELLSAENSRVEYLPPWTFDNLLFRFTKLNEINPSRAFATPSFEYPQIRLNSFVAKKWREYHRRNAQLILISSEDALIEPRKDSSTDAAPEWTCLLE